MEDQSLRVRLMCSVQRALLGQIDRRVIGVTCGLRGKIIVLRSYVEPPVRPEDVERIQLISSEVITDFFDEGYTIQEECQTGKYEHIWALDFWAYLRAPDEEWFAKDPGKPPTHEEVVQKLRQLVAGEVTPGQASDWARPWATEARLDLFDNINVRRAIGCLAVADTIMDREGHLVHGRVDFERWLNELTGR